MITLENFQIKNQNKDLGSLVCSADVGLKNLQDIKSDLNATNFSKITTLDYEMKLTDDKNKFECKELLYFLNYPFLSFYVCKLVLHCLY